MLKRFGTEYGGFTYPLNLDGLSNNSIIYCFGAGEDISHDIEIAHQLNSNVYIFDPTPRSILHVNYIKNIFNNIEEPINNIRYGGGYLNYIENILSNKINPNNIIFQACGIYIKNDILKFYKPTNTEYVSHSLCKGMKSNDYINVEVKTLKTIMKEYGHDKIDLLKLDIEGSECDVFDDMLNNNIYPKYLSFDFDLGYNGEKFRDLDKCNETINKLITNGYKILFSDKSDYSFVLD